MLTSLNHNWPLVAKELILCLVVKVSCSIYAYYQEVNNDDQIYKGKIKKGWSSPRDPYPHRGEEG